MLDLMLQWTEAKIKALGSSHSKGIQGDGSILAEELNVALEKWEVTNLQF